jgi:hypothetical protein
VRPAARASLVACLFFLFERSARPASRESGKVLLQELSRCARGIVQCHRVERVAVIAARSGMNPQSKG